MRSRDAGQQRVSQAQFMGKIAGQDCCEATLIFRGVNEIFRIEELWVFFGLTSCGSGEMADTQVLGTCASACGFKSHLPHQTHTSRVSILGQAR